MDGRDKERLGLNTKRVSKPHPYAHFVHGMESDGEVRDVGFSSSVSESREGFGEKEMEGEPGSEEQGD